MINQSWAALEEVEQALSGVAAGSLLPYGEEEVTPALPCHFLISHDDAHWCSKKSATGTDLISNLHTIT